MKKILMTESQKEKEQSAPMPMDAAGAAGQSEEDDPMVGLQANLDRFRDLTLRSQADFENYKKRCAREKKEAIKYANNSLLQRFVAIIDNFELGLADAKKQGQQSPIYSGMVLVQKQLNDLLAE